MVPLQHANCVQPAKLVTLDRVNAPHALKARNQMRLCLVLKRAFFRPVYCAKVVSTSITAQIVSFQTAANANLVENVKMMRPESIAEMMLVSMMLKESANQLSNYHILRFVQKNEP